MTIAHRLTREIFTLAHEIGHAVLHMELKCADCVLAGKADTLNVFIHSEMSFKIERSIAEHGLEREKAASILARRDKARAQHYRFYTDQRWGDARHYDLCLDSGRLGVESCVALIAEAYRCMG